MKDHKIEIYVRNLSSDVFYSLLTDFFCKDNSPFESIYIENISRKIIDPDYEDGFYFDFRVLEVPDNDDLPFDTVLAKIRTQTYPSQLVVFIEVEELQEDNWPKVENIVQKIISQMELMKFEIESVVPSDFRAKSLQISPMEKLSKVAKSKSPRSVEPWEKIEDHASNREILRLWHQEQINSEIGMRVNLSKRSVTNIISMLRKKYGNEIVLTNEERKRKKSP